MSSASGENNINSDHNFSSESRFSKPVSTKPTTEICVITSTSQDDRLKNRHTSSKLSPVVSTISSSVTNESQDYGGLKNKEESGNSEISLNSQPQNSTEQDAASVGKPSLRKPVVKEICRFYEKNGFCRFGRHCRYSHKVLRQHTPARSETNVGDLSVITNDDISIPRASQDVPKEELVCNFFARKGFCRYGGSCKFSHQISEATSVDLVSKEQQSEATLKEPINEDENSYKTLEGDSSKSGPSSSTKKPSKICRFYSRFGRCSFGDSCKYQHVKQKKITKEYNAVKELVAEHNEITKKEEESIQSNEEGQCKPDVILSQPVSLRNKKSSEMTSDDFLKLRKTEINNLKRKFSKAATTNLPDIGDVFEVEFFPTDPDWRFDVKSITMSVMIPENYPEENLQVDLLNLDDVLPQKLVRYFNNTTFVWLQAQQDKNRLNDEVVLIFRPFIKWLDNSLEDIFIAGLKMVKRDMEAEAAGIQFVTHQELNAKNREKEASKPAVEEVFAEDPETEDYSYSSQEYDDRMPEDMSSQTTLMESTVNVRMMTETAKRGTEIKLRNLELLEGAAALTCWKLSITMQCGRCTMRNDVAILPQRSHRVVCERCHHQQKLTFRPQMIHQFCSVAGYLDLDNCQVVDIPLLTCEFALQCLPCGRQNLISGIQNGQSHTTWCMFCHSKMAVKVESVKLNQLQPNVEQIVAKAGQPLKLEKKEKRVKDPTIQEGKPLPDNGTCKHYKKSFRWLRFPCCGKAYPCDQCHDEKETDHDMKLANRMICGYCAKEQPYSNDRPCQSCLSNMTKKSGPHWEGGKGCRDKMKMSKDDRQKYSGLNKTISRKVQPAQKKEK